MRVYWACNGVCGLATELRTLNESLLPFDKGEETRDDVKNRIRKKKDFTNNRLKQLDNLTTNLAPIYERALYANYPSDSHKSLGTSAVTRYKRNQKKESD